jgi:hypothetical protein
MQMVVQSFRITLFAAICLVFAYAVLQILGLSPALGGLTVLVFALILGVVQLGTIGTIRDWIGRTYQNAKNRLRFVK